MCVTLFSVVVSFGLSSPNSQSYLVTFFFEPNVSILAIICVGYAAGIVCGIIVTICGIFSTLMLSLKTMELFSFNVIFFAPKADDAEKPALSKAIVKNSEEINAGVCVKFQKLFSVVSPPKSDEEYLLSNSDSANSWALAWDMNLIGTMHPVAGQTTFA